jgi:hypothetical protein
MTAFSPSQIDDLKPLARRYDLSLEDDFVVSVLPNGIKTWVYVYAQDGRLQRRTLGVYPDMNIDTARLSLAAARATRQSLQDAMERSARAAAARAEPRRALPPLPAQRHFALASSLAAGLVLVAGAWLGLRVAGHGAAPAAVAELPAAARTTPAPAVATSTNDIPSAGAASAEDQTAADADETENDASVSMEGTQHAARSGEPIAPASAVSPPSVTPGATQTAATVSGASAEASMSAADRVPETVLAAAATPAPAAVGVPASTENAPSGAGEMVASSQAEVAVASRSAEGVVKHDARVARAVLTDKVVKREPVGSVGPEIQGEPGGVAQLFFYTEVRGLGGQRLHYRWEHEGRVQAELPMLVGTGWRWRSYSRKDLLPTQTGRWQVQLLDASDRVLAETSFVYRNDAPGTQSAEAN